MGNRDHRHIYRLPLPPTSPRSLLLADPSTEFWHKFGMEWKEHIAWISKELKILQEMYAHLRLYVNFFKPQMKLISKTRKGAKVSKKFARTPYQRLLASTDISEQTKCALRTTYEKLNPAH